MNSRKVTRVLVMLEYEPGSPDNGEVFDLTALAAEMREKSELAGKSGYRGSIWMTVRAMKEYGRGPNGEALPPSLEIDWRADAGGEWSHHSGHLADAINSGLPDGERVTAIRQKATKLRKKAEQLDREASSAKLEQVAAVRSQHPIARVTETAPALADLN